MNRITGNYWIFLLAGFVSACLLGGFGIWMSSGAALKRFQEHSLASHSQEIAATVETQIRDHINAFQFLARRPRLISAVLGDETEFENVRDVLRTFDLYKDVHVVELIDVIGDPIVSERLVTEQSPSERPEQKTYMPTVMEVLEADGDADFRVLHTRMGTTDFIISVVPILRNGGTEGALVGIFALNLQQFMTIDSQLLGLSFGEGILGPVSNDRLRTKVEIPETGLTLELLWSLETVLQERYTVVWTVTGSLILGLGIAFSALAWVGRAIILAPQHELERSRAALAESEAKARELAAIAENSLDPTCVNDANGRLIWANEAVYRKWGYTPEEMRGRRPIDLISGPNTDLTKVHRAYQDGSPFVGEIVYYKRDGTPLDVLLSLQPLMDETGQASRYMVVARDISDLKKREMELQEARAKAEAANHAKSNFLANMSHEIRTPMNGIIGMCELLNETDLNPEQSLCARTISESSSALLTIINNILDFSKIEAGKQDLKNERFSLAGIVTEICRLLYPKAQEKNLELCIDYDDTVPDHFEGDDGRVRQILLNLIGNAIKFTETGYIVVQVASRADWPEQGVMITVRDTGIGIPASKIGTVFQAFEQADNESTRQHDGTGLGLAITKKLIELMGGTIELHSIEGEGSEFTIDLPLPSCPVEDQLDQERSAVLRGKRVLIVDDLEINRYLLSLRLAALGAVSVTAESGEQALDLVLASSDNTGTPFDLGIFDHQMPNMDGEMLMVALRGTADATPFPTILFSSMDYSVDAQRLRGLGFAGILMKPATRETLCAVVEQALLGPKHDTSLPAWKHLAATKDTPDTTTPVSKENLQVLIAEDNRTNQLVLKKMLASFPVEPDAYLNGELVLEAYKSRGADLIFMDLSMPVMGGLEATRLIREFERETGKPPCPIIALTAKAMKHHQQECFAAGMDDFLTKPLRKAELSVVLEKYGAPASPKTEIRRTGT